MVAVCAACTGHPEFQHTLAESSVVKLVVKIEANCSYGRKKGERAGGYLPSAVWTGSRRGFPAPDGVGN